MDLRRRRVRQHRHQRDHQVDLRRRHVRQHRHQPVSQADLLLQHVNQVPTILLSDPAHLQWGHPAPEVAEVTAVAEGMVVAGFPEVAEALVEAEAEAEDDK